LCTNVIFRVRFRAVCAKIRARTLALPFSPVNEVF
jgi:hypothetical protein